MLAFSIYFYSILIFHGVHTLTPQASCKLSLSMQMFGVHSTSRCWLFQNMLFNLYFSWGLTSFIPSLSKQVVNSHSPNRCWLFLFFLIFDAVSHFSYLHSPNRFKVHALYADVWFTLSQQMLALSNSPMFHRISYSHSPCQV